MRREEGYSMKKSCFLAVLFILGSITAMGSIPVNAAERADISQFIGYYRVDIDDSVPDYNCDIRVLEYTIDGQLQEAQALSAGTTGTTILYRFTDYNIVGNVLEGSYDHAYGYAETDHGGDYVPLNDYPAGKHQMVLTEDGNIICDGQIWYRYDREIG
mgnify:CR=1 FL=1